MTTACPSRSAGGEEVLDVGLEDLDHRCVHPLCQRHVLKEWRVFAPVVGHTLLLLTEDRYEYDEKNIGMFSSSTQEVHRGLPVIASR
jgi:hypothetical protein